MGDPRSRAAAAAQCYRHAGVRGQRRQRPDDPAALFVPARGPDPARSGEDLPRLGAWVLVPASRRVRCRRRGIPHQRWLEPPVPSPGDLVVAMTSVLDDISTTREGDPYELTVFPRRSRFGLRGAEPAGRVRRHVHQPVHRHWRSAPARIPGGDGPPLLLVHGWPQTWYAWRLVMPALARSFSVVVPDQRGCGLSGKPEDGYDTGTLAADL